MNKNKKLISFILALCMVFSCVVVLGPADVHAASKKIKVGKVTKVQVKVLDHRTASVKWKKLKKEKGTVLCYEVYRDGKRVGSTEGKNFTDEDLRPGSTYTYKVRACLYYNVKQYYNTKTKKWVTKKPAKKNWKGKKTRILSKKKFGKFSPAVTVTTPTRVLPPESDFPNVDTAREQTLAAINAYRESKSLPALTVDETLQDIAQKRAGWMAENDRTKEYIPELGGDAGDMAKAAGMNFWAVWEAYKGNMTSFDYSTIIYLEASDGLSFGMDLVQPDMRIVGIGYNRGYLDIVILP